MSGGFRVSCIFVSINSSVLEVAVGTLSISRRGNLIPECISSWTAVGRELGRCCSITSFAYLSWCMLFEAVVVI